VNPGTTVFVVLAGEWKVRKHKVIQRVEGYYGGRTRLVVRVGGYDREFRDMDSAYRRLSVGATPEEALEGERQRRIALAALLRERAAELRAKADTVDAQIAALMDGVTEDAAP